MSQAGWAVCPWRGKQMLLTVWPWGPAACSTWIIRVSRSRLWLLSITPQHWYLWASHALPCSRLDLLFLPPYESPVTCIPNLLGLSVSHVTFQEQLLRVFFSLFRIPQRRRKWHPTPVLLPGKSRGWKSLVGYSPRGHEESDTT